MNASRRPAAPPRSQDSIARATRRPGALGAEQARDVELDDALRGKERPVEKGVRNRLGGRVVLEPQDLGAPGRQGVADAGRRLLDEELDVAGDEDRRRRGVEAGNRLFGERDLGHPAAV